MIRLSFRCAFIASCLFAVSAVAREGVVTLNDGRTLSGDITETDGNVTMTIHGIRTVFPRSDVQAIEYGVDVEKEFNERLAQLGQDDAKGRMELARWAFDQEAYELARTAVNQALLINPNDSEAATLQATIQSQMRLQQVQAGAATRPATTTTTTPTTAATARSPVDGGRPVLGLDDINTIRQKELQSADSQVRFSFASDVRRRFATQQNIPVTQFTRRGALAQALDILDEGSDEMKKDVRVMSDPASLFEYRRTIQPIVISSCGTSGCHGGQTGAGEFRILNPADTEAAVYTNFYLLQSYRKERPGDQTLFSGGDLRLIDRTHPSESLLLSYGLPTNIALFDHPQVQGWKPAFRGLDDPSYTRLFNWITTSLKPVEPEYGIQFNAATQPAATSTSEEPATAPTTTTAPKPAEEPATGTEPATED